jgi:hypothetical protein
MDAQFISFQRRVQLEQHGPSMEDIEKDDLTCPECKKDFANNNNLKKHYRRFHIGDTKYR